MDSVSFYTVAWLLMFGFTPTTTPPFADEAHCKAFIAQQGLNKTKEQMEADRYSMHVSDTYQCLQVWGKRE